jgi:2-dehydro-3-deoxygalactonokinase
MRGEEVQAIGSGVTDGLLCLPGTHSKWIEMAQGRIVRFATFITGELYAAMSASFVGRLASEPETLDLGLKAGAQAAQFGGGLSRLLFQARAQVLGGDLGGGSVRPFLSSLLVGQEIIGAENLFGACRAVGLVAASPQREVYAAALAQRGIEVTLVDPSLASLAGLRRVATNLL